MIDSGEAVGASKTFGLEQKMSPVDNNTIQPPNPNPDTSFKYLSQWLIVSGYPNRCSNACGPHILEACLPSTHAGSSRRQPLQRLKPNRPNHSTRTPTHRLCQALDWSDD